MPLPQVNNICDQARASSNGAHLWMLCAIDLLQDGDALSVRALSIVKA